MRGPAVQTLTASLRAFFATAPEPAFRRTAVGWMLAILNLGMAINGAVVFLGLLQVGVIGWLMMNSCAIFIALFFLSFLSGKPVLLLASLVPLYRFGTLGLFVFGWSGTDLVAQAGHIGMTLAVLYFVAEAIRNRRWKAWGFGMALGIMLLSIFITVQELWMVNHASTMLQLLNGTLAPPA
jgi:hypothetical protein